jgi:FkbM family methyltransferase
MIQRKTTAQLYNKVRSKYKRLLWELLRRFHNEVTISTQQGKFEIYALANESIGRSLFCHGQYELDLITDVLQFLRTQPNFPEKGKGTVVDIGANNGVISIGLLYRGEMEKAIAIEPAPQNFSLLRKNVELNGLIDRVTCLPYAVSDKKEEVLFELSETNLGDHRVRATHTDGIPEMHNESNRKVISVPADQLDHILSNQSKSFTDGISLIWVDVQGHEGHVFLGAKQMLSTGIPLVSEIWPYGIKRSGMSVDNFFNIVSGIWTSYWIRRNGKFTKYPIGDLKKLFDELGDQGKHENIIFTTI